MNRFGMLFGAVVMGSLMVFSAVPVRAEMDCANAAADASCAQGKCPHMKMGRGEKAMFKDLGLSQDQIAGMKANRKAIAAKTKAVREQLKEKREALRVELDKPQSDQAVVNALSADIKNLTGQMMDARTEGVLETKKILTPEQFKKMTGRMEEHRKCMKSCRDKKGKGMKGPQGPEGPEGPGSEAGE